MSSKKFIMYNHAPQDYKCPICLAIAGVESDDTMIKQADIIYRDDFVLSFIGSKFIPGHEGYLLVVPVRHYENIYELTKDCAHRIVEVTKAMAIATKIVHKSDGVTIIQNNEPAGGQHAFHYHAHIVPRYAGDRFYVESSKARKSEPEERLGYATAFREYLSVHSID